jgi:hypothetical protein
MYSWISRMASRKYRKATAEWIRKAGSEGSDIFGDWEGNNASSVR